MRLESALEHIIIDQQLANQQLFLLIEFEG
jgi:hypothetical protein